MSAPVKPWETKNFQRTDLGSLSNDMSASPFDRIQSAVGGPAAPVSSAASLPPQLPPRPSEQNSSLNNRLGFNSGLYGGYGGGYGGIGMGYGGYGGYSSPYSSFGGYGGYGGYNRLGGDMSSTFARHAEESSRPAFESINSIVQAVNSVGMMLDSTFQAVYNSFRAVIGVADNFSRLKSQLVQIFSALAFIRTIRYFLRRVLEFLRMRPKGDADRLWTEAVKHAAATSAAAPGGGPGKSSWPILMFFGIIMGGPYLIWKVISAFSGSTDEAAWARGETDHYVAAANYSFQGEGAEELSFAAGQTLTIAPKELQPRVRGWLLASVDGKTTGMIPANYVKVLGKRKGSKIPDQPQQVPIVPSVSSTVLSSQWSQLGQANNSTRVHVPENQLESAFSSVPYAGQRSAAASADSSVSNQDAAEILNNSGD